MRITAPPMFHRSSVTTLGSMSVVIVRRDRDAGSKQRYPDSQILPAGMGSDPRTCDSEPRLAYAGVTEGLQSHPDRGCHAGSAARRPTTLRRRRASTGPCPIRTVPDLLQSQRASAWSMAPFCMQDRDRDLQGRPVSLRRLRSKRNAGMNVSPGQPRRGGTPSHWIAAFA